MLKKLLIYLLFFLIPPNLCFGFTNEQDKVLEYVNKHCGVHKKDIAAIIQQESFLGDKIVRRGDSGAAHGIGQMHIPTAIHVIENLYGKNHGYSKKQIANKLLTDDEFAVILTLRYYQYLLKVFRYDRKKAILAYNVGLGRVLKYGLSFDPNNYLSKVLSYRKETQFIC
ncbi:MAG: lytic transglycosylase domain-containing protein [Bacteroidales bacterium]|jgi:soluble lytic murein transglycosylase-like protein|nr:lytic transglycosylase domain-containing protein [Bacteroidales bacterium]